MGGLCLHVALKERSTGRSCKKRGRTERRPHCMLQRFASAPIIVPARQWRPDGPANRNSPEPEGEGSLCRTPKPCRSQALQGWRSGSDRCPPVSDRGGGSQTACSVGCRLVGLPCPGGNRPPP